MTENEAIKRMKYRIDSATDIAGKGVDGKAYEDMEMAIKALEEIQQYREIGTVEECGEARERQMAKKPILDTIYHQQYYCPNCEDFLARKNGNKPYHCICGQAIDWSENNGE